MRRWRPGDDGRSCTVVFNVGEGEGGCGGREGLGCGIRGGNVFTVARLRKETGFTPAVKSQRMISLQQIIFRIEPATQCEIQRDSQIHFHPIVMNE